MSEILAIVKNKKEIDVLTEYLEKNYNVDFSSIISRAHTDVYPDKKEDSSLFAIFWGCFIALESFIVKSKTFFELFDDLFEHLIISSLYTLTYLQSTDYIKASYLLNSEKPKIRQFNQKTVLDEFSILKPSKTVKLNLDYSETEIIHRKIKNSQKGILDFLYNTKLFGPKNQESLYIQNFLPCLAWINFVFDSGTKHQPSTAPYTLFSTTKKNGDDVPVKERNRRLKIALEALTNDYNYLLHIGYHLPCNHSRANNVLFYYKLERILPLSMLQESLHLIKEDSSFGQIIPLLCQLPNVYTRYKVAYQLRPSVYTREHRYYKKHYEDIANDLQNLIDTLIPLFEKIFFVSLVKLYQYDYEKMYQRLEEYITSKPKYSKALQLCNHSDFFDYYLRISSHKDIPLYTSKIIEQLFNYQEHLTVLKNDSHNDLLQPSNPYTFI